MNSLNVFVSSTCFDLSQIRTDLRESISSLGHTPILSEYPEFPINPSNNTVENCIEAINNHADLLILIIGNRYGYKLESGKSITNMEFITAKNKGIPIYVFISKQIINLLPIYLKNKTSDYSEIVDTPEIFDFANNIRSSSGLWSFEFEKFQDIFLILKTQLSYLFKESLKIKTRFQESENNSFYKNLSTKALKVLFNKDKLFEYEFLAQVMVDEIEKHEALKNDYEYRLILESNQRIIDNADFIGWISDKLSSMLKYLPNLMYLVNDLIPMYLGKEGEPSDLKGLYYVANTYGRVCASFINWTIEIYSITVKENQEDLRNALADFSSKLIETTWDFPFLLQSEINQAKIRLQEGEENIKLNLTLNLELDQFVMDRYNNAFQEFSNSYYSD